MGGGLGVRNAGVALAANRRRYILKKYIAYHVDMFGFAKASYELNAKNDEDAKSEARLLLEIYPAIEVWQGPRWVARFARDIPPPRLPRGH
jgi:hypothetical protein